MNKFFIFLALIATPAYAQQEINYYARDFPQWAERDKGTEIERSYNDAIKAADENAKVMAKSKNVTPTIRIEGTIVVQVRVDDGRYRPVCPYNNCR